MSSHSTLLCGIILFLFIGAPSRKDASTWNLTAQKSAPTFTPSPHFQTGTAAARVLLDSARIMKDSTHYHAALMKIRQAINLYRESAGKTDTRLIRPLNLKSELFWRTDQLDSALVAVKEALEIGRKGPEEAHPALIDTYNNLGVIHLLKAEYDQALHFYEQALGIHEKVPGKRGLQLAGIFDNMGIAYYSKGNYARALICFEKALPIKLSAVGEDHPSVADSYHRIGVAHSVRGAYKRGLSYYEKALAIRLSIYGPNHPAPGRTYNNMGINHENTGNYERALTYYKKALEILGKTMGPDHTSLMSIYGNTGDLHYKLGAYDTALGAYQKALDIQMKTRSADHPDLAWIYQGMADVYLARGKYHQALNLNEKALSIRLKTRQANHPNVADIYLQKGKVYLVQKKYIRALSWFQQAARILKYDWAAPFSFDQVTDLKSLHSILSQQKAYYTQKMEQNQHSPYLDSLHSHYRIMLALEDHIQQYYTSASMRQFYAARSLPVYEGAIAVLLLRNQPGDLTEAFLLAEKTKSRQLAEKIQSASSNVHFGIPDSLRKQEHELNIDIAYYEKKAFEEEYEKNIPNDSLLKVYHGHLFELHREREGLLKTLKNQFPDYFRLRYAPQVIDIAGVQKDLLEKDNQALVEYFVGDSSIYAFTVLPDTLHIRKIARDFPLEQWVSEFRCGLFAGYLTEAACDSMSRQAGQKLYAQRAQQLYQKLFAPVDSLLPRNTEVLLVPDGLLGYLPFEALLTEAPKPEAGFYQYDYLLRDHLISYAYSATLQREMQIKQHRQAPRKTLAAFAPHFGRAGTAADSNLLVTRFIDAGLRRNRLTPLHYNRAEAEAVAAIFDGHSLTGTEATEAAFRQQAADYRILHLATHSKANDRAGDYSFLSFQTLDDSLENEWLYNSELYNLQLNADLVVLSACETGIGELQRGEGLISLARGFSYAGAKSIVTSLWNVSDQHTQDLMTRFYLYLKKGMPKHLALRRAKLDYLDEQEGPARSPFFWAGFIPIGDMAPVTSNQSGYWAALAALGIFLLAGGLLWRHFASR